MNYQFKARNKKNFGSGQLIFENWSGGPVDLFSFFLNHNINIPYLIVLKVLKLHEATQNADERGFR